MAGMNWTTQSGYLHSDKLTKAFQKAAQPLTRFRQFCSVKEAFGKGAGDAVNWLKVANVGTYGGSLTETSTFHETSQSLSWGTLSLNEYGNSLPFTFKMEALSEFDIVNIMKEGLLDDMVKCVDGLIEREFNSCCLRYVGTQTNTYALTTNGTATAVNTSALNSYHIYNILSVMKSRSIPGFSSLGGDYVCIASVEAIADMLEMLDSTGRYVSQGYEGILNGEVGRYAGIRFVEDQFATRYTYSSSGRTATAKSWTGANSLDAYFFGAPTVMEAIAVPEEIRMKVPSDYGRSKGIAWYMLGGWRIMWGTSTNQDTCRIVKWDSA